MRSSQHRIGTRPHGPTVVVNISNGVTREPLCAQSWKCYNPYFTHNTKWGSTQFQWEYVWLNLWHVISQQPCDIEGWFPGMLSRSRRLGLETVSRRTNVSSRSRPERSHAHSWWFQRITYRKTLHCGYNGQNNVTKNVTQPKWWQFKDEVVVVGDKRWL